MINNLINPPPVFPLSADLHFEICDQLRISYLPPNFRNEIYDQVLACKRKIAPLNCTGLRIAKEYILEIAKRWGCKSPKSVQHAINYIHKIDAEKKQLESNGFLPSFLFFRSMADLCRHLIPSNKNRECVLHFLASKNLTKVIKFMPSHFSKFINRPIYGKTPAMIISEHGNEKALRYLMEKGANMEGTQPASIFLHAWILLDIFSNLKTACDLLSVGSVSKAWRNISKENRLWEPIYRNYFPKVAVSSIGQPHQYWETKLAQYYKNASRGFFVEEVIPHHAGKIVGVWMTGDHLILRFNNNGNNAFQLWKTTPRIGHLLTIDHDFVPNGVGSAYFYIIGSILCVYRGNRLRCTWFGNDGKQFENAYPSHVVGFFGNEDRIIVQLENGTLDAIYFNDQMKEVRREILFLPELNQPHFGAATKDWLAIRENDELVLLNHDQNGKLLDMQRLELPEGTGPSKLTFGCTMNGTGLLIVETPIDKSKTLTVCSFDSEINKWKVTLKISGVQLLSQEGDYLFVSEYPSRNLRWKLGGYDYWDGTYAKTIDSYQWNVKGYIPCCRFNNALKLSFTRYFRGNVIFNAECPEPITIENLWEPLYSFTSKNGILTVIAQQDDTIGIGRGDFFFFDGRPNKGLVHKLKRGTLSDLGTDTNQYYTNQYGQTLWITDQEKMSGKATPIGFLSNGSQVMLDSDRGVVIRNYDVALSKVLINIANGIFCVPSFTDFKSELEIANVAYLYNRFRLFDKKTQNAMIQHLSRIIQKTFRLKYRFTLDNNETVAQDAFWGNNGRMTTQHDIYIAIVETAKELLDQDL